MTIDDIRKLAAKEREVAAKAIPGQKRAGRHMARARAVVPALCDAIDALLTVIDALPRCDYGLDFGHGKLPLVRTCARPATKQILRYGKACEVHAAQFSELGWYDLPYAAALRALLRQ